MSADKATRASQLTGEACSVEDTEEMRLLRRRDDAQSLLSLGTLLAGQYRFREAEAAFCAAMRQKADDPGLWLRVAGSRLTLFSFDGAKEAYERAVACGMDEKAVAYPMGVLHYLRGENDTAARWFEKCLPCDDETAAAVIYWHTLCRAREGKTVELCGRHRELKDVGHHVSYLCAVRLFDGEIPPGTVEEALCAFNDLDFSIAAYGYAVWLREKGDAQKSAALLREIAGRESVWPCVSALAAYLDARRETRGEA